MASSINDICCPKFDPGPWDGQEVTWDHKRFVKDHVRCLFHIPINFGKVMRRNMERIEAAGAKSGEGMVLADDVSLWRTNVYIAVTGDVPNAEMTALSGTFLSKVFEGPYKDIRIWIEDMKQHVAKANRRLEKIYTYYTTCPKCAKKYGRNYVVLLARV